MKHIYESSLASSWAITLRDQMELHVVCRKTEGLQSPTRYVLGATTPENAPKGEYTICMFPDQCEFYLQVSQTTLLRLLVHFGVDREVIIDLFKKLDRIVLESDICYPLFESGEERLWHLNRAVTDALRRNPESKAEQIFSDVFYAFKQRR